MSFLDDEETALQPAAPAQVRIRTSEEKQLDKLRSIEDRILAKSMATVEDYCAARDIDPSQEGPPPEWVSEMGEVEAKKRWRVAMAAWANKKDAPVFLELAQRTATAIIKARATQPATISQLNVAFVVAVPPKATKAYPVIDVEVEEVGEK